MLINDSDALSRLGSKENLFNKLKSRGENRGLDLFRKPEGFVSPFSKSTHEVAESIVDDQHSELPSAVSIDELIPEVDYDIKLQEAHNKAIDVLTATLDELGIQVSNIKPEKLAAVAASSIKVIDSIRKEKLERSKLGKSETTHYHFYTPTPRRIEDFEVITVGSGKSTEASHQHS